MVSLMTRCSVACCVSPHQRCDDWVTQLRALIPRFYDTKAVLLNNAFRGKVMDSSLQNAFRVMTDSAAFSQGVLHARSCDRVVYLMFGSYCCRAGCAVRIFA
jgi:hypothetical protein